jgi:signal transduction histidine kinase
VPADAVGRVTPTFDRLMVRDSCLGWGAMNIAPPPAASTGVRTLGTVRMGDRTTAVVTDAGLAVLFLAAFVVEAVAVAQSWGPAYWLIGGAAAVLVCSVALVRRRRPVPFAAAGLTIAAVAVVTSSVLRMPAEPGPAMALGLAVLTGAALRAAPTVPAVAVAAGGLGVVLGAQVAGPSWAAGPAPVTWLNLLTWLGGTAAGLTLRLTDRRTRANAERIRHEERLELARELHDVAAHHITGIILQTQAAQLLARRDAERVPERLAVIEVAGTEALAAMRRVVGLLRDAEDGAPSEPEPEELSTLVARFAQQAGPVRLRTPDGMTGWPPEVTSTVYRIVREALTNVSRHAPQAGNVTVTVAQGDQITVEVTNDAPAAPPRFPHRGGYGLVGMRERVRSLGGTLRAGPRPGGGWSVAATLPRPGRERR